MSQRNLKCTVCSGSHSWLHCTFICKSCGGNYRQCECETVIRQSRPNKRQRNAEARETDSERNNKELQKRYDSLLKDDKRLAQAFRNQEQETKLLAQQLVEKEKEYEEVANDAEELANLVRTKCEAIKTLEKRLVEAKKLIASLKQELQSERNSRIQTHHNSNRPASVATASAAYTPDTTKFYKRRRITTAVWPMPVAYLVVPGAPSEISSR